MTERVVLAHSGGLDTSVRIGWIADAAVAGANGRIAAGRGAAQ